jgi:hypothetical protein
VILACYAIPCLQAIKTGDQAKANQAANDAAKAAAEAADKVLKAGGTPAAAAEAAKGAAKGGQVGTSSPDPRAQQALSAPAEQN